jgi:hypothetical protein
MLLHCCITYEHQYLNNINQVCSYDGTIYPVCDNVTVQECYDLEDNVICAEPEQQQQQQLPPCSAITTLAGPCLNDQGQQDMKMCTTSMHVSSIACKQGKTAEQVCADNPSTEVCPGAEQRITEPITPVPEPEPTPITPKPQPQPEPPLPDPGMILPPPEVREGEDTEEEQNNENENEESGGAEEEGGGGESDSDGDSSGSEGGA